MTQQSHRALDAIIASIVAALRRTKELDAALARIRAGTAASQAGALRH
ncbi:MAG: hypothetical protein M0Z84_00575 [Gammaproteobacteria bacterium]|nr:hypothetical protein [Gammaproteobacteria bacterium]